MPICDTYIDGTYASKTRGTWHLEDAPYKADQVLRMLARHPDLAVSTICDIGCGAGGVLAELDRRSSGLSALVGYDLSPQAHALSEGFRSPTCSFRLQDSFVHPDTFDLALILDVVEHVEDCFGFLRQCAAKATWKLYHIPLDTSASMVLRGANCWDSVGHLHLFTMETALKSIEHTGQRIVDWFLTPTSLARPHRFATRLTNIPRRLLPTTIASRILGGYSIMILAR